MSQSGFTHGLVDTTSLPNEITIPSYISLSADPSLHPFSVRAILAVVFVSIVLLVFMLFVVIIAVKHWQASRSKNITPLATEEERNYCCHIKHSRCIVCFTSYGCMLKDLLYGRSRMNKINTRSLKSNNGDVYV